MRYNRIIAPIMLITMLSGCSDGLFGLGRNDPPSIYGTCTRLKRQLIFFRNDMNHNYQWSSPGDKAALMAEYQRYNCEAVLNHQDNVEVKKSPLSSGWKKSHTGPSHSHALPSSREKINTGQTGLGHREV